MNLKPLHSNVIIKPVADETVTKLGIILPETINKEKPEKGEVVAVGAGRVLENGQVAPMSVKVGDKVMFRKYTPDEIKVDGEDYLIIKEQDIMLILE
jgi:chaperonin GroES